MPRGLTALPNPGYIEVPWDTPARVVSLGELWYTASPSRRWRAAHNVPSERTKATPLLRNNTGRLDLASSPVTLEGIAAVAARSCQGTTSAPGKAPDVDNSNKGVDAREVSTAGPRPQANIKANKAVTINPAVVPRTNHSLNLGAKRIVCINRSLTLNS